MRIESLEEVSENLRDRFKLVEEDGKKYYQDDDALELKSLAFNVKDENKALKEKLSGFESKLAEFETEKARAIEEAEQRTLEKARKDGDFETLERRANEKFEHLESTKNAEIEELTAQLKALKDGIKAEKKNSFIANLKAEMATDKGAKAFEMLVSRYIDINPETGEKTYLDDAGGATSLDDEGFKKFVMQNELFAPLVKSGVVTSGGGNVNGSASGTGATKKFNEYNGAELMEMRKTNPALYENLKRQFYS